MVIDSSGLGTYLRTLRTQITPESVGLPVSGRQRRVPGLRREEVARLAGVSVSYYTSLEQGRAVRVSPQVLRAIARTLRLGEAEEGHLLTLATPVEERRDARSPEPRSPEPHSSQSRSAESLQALLDAMPGVPAVAHDSVANVLAWNRLGRLLYAPFHDGNLGQPVNLVRMVFLEPWCRTFFVDWRAKAETLVAFGRLIAAREPRNTALSNLVSELTARSPDFARMWSNQRVRTPTVAETELSHPFVGQLTVTQRALSGLAPTDTYIVVTTAEPGSESEERLRRLSAVNPPPNLTARWDRDDAR